MATRADRPYLSIDKDIDTDPFLLWLGKELLRDSKSALLFLWEQPGQLKYIEWPSFQSTLKTATLTLLLVMLLIIFLSSVDSVLSYLLVLTLRRSS
jgi:preprotein translocase subunit SecE